MNKQIESPADYVPMTRRWPGTVARLAAAGVGVAAAGALVIQGSNAAFTATTDNNGNSVSAGTVVLDDDDANTKLFDLTGLNGGQTFTRCINVTYKGSLTSDVKLYGSVGGTGLAAGINTTVDVGTGAAGGATFGCGGFTQDDAGAEFNGTLAGFGTSHSNFANGLGEYDNATNPTTKSYKVSVTLTNDNSYQGKNATVSFTWEAQGEDVP
jgi:predicted ribosomally synthesized peptide with SipW-like signal peptide